MPHTSTVPEWVDGLFYRIFGRLFTPRVICEAESIFGVLAIATDLRRAGCAAALDLVLEDVPDQETVSRVLGVYRSLLRAMNDDSAANIVVKPTALGLALTGIDRDARRDRFLGNLRWLSRELRGFELRREISLGDWGNQGIVRYDTPRDLLPDIEVDAESSRTIEDAFAAVAQVRREQRDHRDRIKVAIQLHLKELPSLLDRYDLLDHPVRIVKGAGVYAENPDLLVPESEIVRRYEKYFLECLTRRVRPAIASVRDERLIRILIARALSAGFTKDDFEVEVLYGFGGGMVRRLRNDGYRVRVYVPFTLPWCRASSKAYVRRRVTMLRRLIVKWTKERMFGPSPGV